MSSIWTDLLFLHGHLVRKEDLIWERDQCAENEPDNMVAKVSPGAPRSPAPGRRPFRWPRLAGPR